MSAPAGRLHLVTLENLARPSGQQARLAGLLPELATHFDLVLVSRAPAPPPLDRLFKDTILLPMPPDVRPLRWLLAAAGPWRWRRLARALGRLPLAGEAVYCESLLLAGLVAPTRPGLLAAEVNGIACEELRRKLGPPGAPLAGWVRHRERDGLRAADRVITVSQTIRHWLGRLDPAAAEAAVVIGNGIDTTLFHSAVDGAPVRRRLGLGEAPTVVFHSTFRPWHGVENLLSAWPLVLERHPCARLLLIGDGPGRPAAQRMALKLGLADSVVLTGAVPSHEIPALIAAADLGAYFPAYGDAEGFLGQPMKLIETLAVGRPVVTLRRPGLSEIVEAAEAGLLAEPTPAAFADAIGELLADPPRRVEMGRRGADYAARHHSWSAIAGGIVDFINKPATST